MSEYWKSTPKYWCKFCSTFVKDTKLERANHEATGRHQGQIQRSIKNLHKDQQALERQQQHAKNEVARLNGLVPSGAAASSSSSSAPPPGAAAKPTFQQKPEQKRATLEDRKRQAEQLAALGVAVPGVVPDGLRGDMALAGEWQVVSKKIIGEDGKEECLSRGVRKRKVDEVEEERIEQESTILQKKGWGNVRRRFPGGPTHPEEEDIEGLLGVGRKSEVKTEEEFKKEDGVKEEGDEKGLEDIPTVEEDARAVKKEEDTPVPAVVFKKRKKVAR